MFRSATELAWLLGFLSAVSPKAQADEPAIRDLTPGVSIEQEIKGGENHSYRVSLAPGQYLHAVVDQKGTDIVVTLFAPSGEKLAEADNPEGIHVPEQVHFVAGASGVYRLQVTPADPKAASGRYELAIRELREATQDDRTRVAAHRALAEGEALHGQQTPKAWRAAIQKYREAVPLWRAIGNQEREARTLLLLGDADAKVGETQAGLECLQQALPLWRASGELLNESKTLNRIGAIYFGLFENQRALEHHQQALALARKARDPMQEAAALNNIGAVYGRLGENRKALEYQQQAQPLYRRAGDRREEAIGLNNIGLRYESLGEIQKALDSFHKSLTLRRSEGDRRGEGITLNNIGLSYDSAGEYQKAAEYYQRALTLRRAVGDRRGEGTSLSNLGATYRAMGEYQKALEHFNQALVVRREVKDRLGEASTLSNIGSVFLDRPARDPQKALDQFRQALPLWRAVGDRNGEAITLMNIGKAHFRSGETQDALNHFNQALSLARSVGARNLEGAILHQIARLARDRHDLMEARAQSEAALAIVEDLRTRVVGENLRASFLASVHEVYESYIDLLMELHRLRPAEGHDREALEAAERARARSLLDTLNEARADIRQGVDPSLLERERSLQQRIDSRAQRERRLLAGKHTEEEAAVAKKELAAILTEYQELQAQIRATSPAYAALTNPQPLRTPQIQQQLLDGQTVLLEYALGEERSFLWVVKPGDVTSFELGKRSEIERLARRFHELLTARNRRLPGEKIEQRRARVAAAQAELPKIAASLSRMLLEPAAGQLTAERLILVAGGALQYVPFAALPSPGQPRAGAEAPPLAAKHEIVNLPSASTLTVLRHEPGGRTRATGTVAVLADPVFDLEDPRLEPRKIRQSLASVARHSTDEAELEEDWERAARAAGAAEAGMHLPRLRFSREEARAIFELAPRSKSLQALDFQASRATVMSGHLGRYRIVHIATHGFFSSDHPELSGLVLSQVDEQGQPVDGFLRLHQIYNLSLPVELVVLSACQTALGREIKGEGLVGLTRGFMHAGATRVVASLWMVDDQATAELMKLFYKGMLGPRRLRPAAALRAAQVSMWKQDRWHSPYYWAGFVLQGEWR